MCSFIICSKNAAPSFVKKKLLIYGSIPNVANYKLLFIIIFFFRSYMFPITLPDSSTYQTIEDVYLQITLLSLPFSPEVVKE